MRWAFFIEANLEPRVAEILRKEGYRAEFSDYVLSEDADDEADILPYVQKEELIIVTADIKNFAPIDESRPRRAVSAEQPAIIRLFGRSSDSRYHSTGRHPGQSERKNANSRSLDTGVKTNPEARAPRSGSAGAARRGRRRGTVGLLRSARNCRGQSPSRVRRLAEQAVADVEQLLQEIEPEAECAIKRITTDSLPETIQDCCGVIAGTADEAAVIVSLGGGARDILLPLTVASLVLTDCIDQALFFSDLDSTVEEWSLPHLRARVPDRTTETFETIAAAGDWLRLSTITDRTTHSKSTVIRHVKDLEDEGVIEADTGQKAKQVRLSFSGELVALAQRGGIA